MDSDRRERFRWADQMPDALWDDVRKRSPEQAADAVGADWDGRMFRVPLIGIEYRVDPAARRITRTGRVDPPVSYQTGVILLSTLAISKGVPPSGRMIVPQDLPGGRMFFTGAHTVPNAPLAGAFDRDAGGLTGKAIDLGGRSIEDTGADVALRIPGLPHVPLYLLLWRGDPEYPGRAVIGIDDRAHFHLDLSGVFALTHLLASRLCRPAAPVTAGSSRSGTDA